MDRITERHSTIVKEVYEKYYNDLSRFAISFLKGAEVMVQEYFVALMRNPERFNKKGNLRFYPVRIVQNQSLFILSNIETDTPDIHAMIDRQESKFTIECFFSFPTSLWKKVMELVYLDQNHTTMLLSF